MRAVEQWNEIERGYPDGWEEARLAFVVEDPRRIADAAATLAPLTPGRRGNELRFQARPSGGVTGAESVRNLLGRLDRNRIWGELRLLDVSTAEPAERAPVPARPGLAAAWDAVLRTLPPDWSDVLCELELDSTDYLARAALLGAPLNPMRNPDAIALRFRVSRRGYGAPEWMARRCFERMDAEGVTGALSLVTALAEVGYEATLGPVWRIAGRSV